MATCTTTPERTTAVGFARALNRGFVRHRLWIAGVLGIFYAASVSSKWQIYPDSSIYLLTARSIAQGKGISIEGQPQGKYPPGFPLYVAILTKMGLTEMLWLNLSMTAMGLAALFCSYRLLGYHTSPRWALLLTLEVLPI